MKNSKNSGSPLFSPLSIFLATVALFILISIIGFQGSSIFSPGKLSTQNTRGLVLANASSHADVETQCKYCHQPFTASQAESCLFCHEDIAEQINLQSGLHGVLSGVNSCRTCHSEHKGRDFDMIKEALEKFDHNQTEFPLDGEHVSVDCQDCHKADEFQISSTCSGCHSEPEIHAGLFSLDCAGCHSTQNWDTANYGESVFDHETLSFQLTKHGFDYQGVALSCMDCHQRNTVDVDQITCKDCHKQHDVSFMQSHLESFGMTCVACHDGVDRMHNFDHNNIFVLDGAHIDLDCTACHQNQVFVGIPNECSACHAEPEIHAGSFGLNCAACHTTDAWQPATLKEHIFPLDHGEEGEIACETCHVSTYIQYTCENCHDSRDPEFLDEHDEEDIDQNNLMNCIECHWDGETHD
ncbi:MAG TPA: cytochrome c3 family protein [Anaerolineaceae bacterium]|nr:cytochrome c3 family protein [Anaerolineaceae bacterium]